jgi:serine protease Do
MKALPLSHALRRCSVSLTTATLLAALLATPVHAQTPAVDAPAASTTASQPPQTPAVALPDFTSIVEKADPAVVNIRTTATIPSRSLAQDGRGPDPSDLFRWFFGPNGQGGQGGPGDDDDAVPGVPPPRVTPGKPAPGRTVPRGVGSGFFISADGYVLTNNHVVSEATDIFVTLTDGREFKAKVIGTDERTDVALLKIDAKDMIPLPIGSPALLKKGQWVLAIGSPFGLDSTVTAGIVSAINRDTGEYLPFIQTDVAVNPGNSGGPLLNLRGEVVGINSQIVSRSGGFMGISLAIPIDEVMTVVNQLRATGKVSRGLIGVQIGEVTSEVATAIGLPKAEGAMVSSVQPGSPSEVAGVLPGDVILQFGDHVITRWSDLPRFVGETKPGVGSTLDVWRRGKRMTLKVKVGEVPAVKLVSSPAPVEKKAEPVLNSLGLALAEVTPENRTKLHVQGGVTVTSAKGMAGAAGIANGDIIVAVNNAEVTGVEQFNKIVTDLDKAKTIALLVRRGDLTQWVALQPTK